MYGGQSRLSNFIRLGLEKLVQIIGFKKTRKNTEILFFCVFFTCIYNYVQYAWGGMKEQIPPKNIKNYETFIYFISKIIKQFIEI